MTKLTKAQKKQYSKVVVGIDSDSSEEEEGDVYTAQSHVEKAAWYQRILFNWAENII